MAPDDSPRKLDLILKAFSLSRGRLAADLGVAKPLVSRWVSGINAPADHNLLALTRLIASRREGFTLLDWERAFDDLAAEFGLEPKARTEITPPPLQPLAGPTLSIPFGLGETASKETARRAAAYTGRWKLTRLGASGQMVFIVEHVVIRQTEAGIAYEHYGVDQCLAGWMLVLNYRLYVMIADETDDSFGFLVLNGVVGPRAERIDGLLTSVGHDRAGGPFSTIVVMERVGDLESEAADRAWATMPGALVGIVPTETVSPTLRAAFARDYGPAAHEAGGDATLRIPADRSLSQGVLQRIGRTG